MYITYKIYILNMTKQISNPLFSIAFKAYSTWNTLPSGENWEADRSYCYQCNFILEVIPYLIFKYNYLIDVLNNDNEFFK